MSETPTPKPYLYFNNVQKETVDLKKAEILIYYDDFNNLYSFMPKNFPFETTTTTPNDKKSPSSKFTVPLTLNKISNSFYPISMTIWGKYYDENNNTFRMIELNDNNNNITTFTVNNDNTISLSIRLVNNTTGLGVSEKSNALRNAVDNGKTERNPPLISKIIILYDVQNSQSMIKSASTKEPYNDMYNKMYIGIM
jgi:hypothetical protein